MRIFNAECLGSKGVHMPHLSVSLDLAGEAHAEASEDAGVR